MSAGADLAQLQAEADAAAAKAAAASKAHQEAEDARELRNAERRQHWWQTTGVPAAKREHQRVTEALRGVRTAIATGDGGAALTAYLTYCRVHAEAAAFTSAAKAATTRTEGHGVDERTVSDVSAISSWPQPFDRLLVEATKHQAGEQGSTYARAQLAPLRTALES